MSIRNIVLMLVAVAIAAGGIVATLHIREGGVSSAESPVDIANKKLILHGEPTLPPDTDLSKPRVLPTVNPADVPKPDSELPTPNPRTCGPQSGPMSATEVLAPYGEIRTACWLLGTQWIITTLGDARSGVTGVIAIYECKETDTECLAGGEPPSAGEWQIFVPPNVAGVTVLAVHLPSTLVINNLAQICFDLVSHTYDTDPKCAELKGAR